MFADESFPAAVLMAPAIELVGRESFGENPSLGLNPPGIRSAAGRLLSPRETSS
jgi:hypothetical protein